MPARRLSTPLAALAALAAAAPAHAAEPVALAVPAPSSGVAVVIAGDEVLFAERPRVDVVRVRAVRPGSRATTRLERSPRDPEAPLSLAASPARAAVVLAGDLFGGPLAGPFAPLSTAATGAAVTGDDLITTERPGRVVVRDLSGRSPGSVLVPGAEGELLGRVRAAGAFVAYATRTEERDTVIVVDRRTGAETLRIALPRTLDDFDVQADGKLAVAVPRTRDATAVGWAAAGRPGVRDVAVAARQTPVRIAGDRIAFVRPAGGEGTEAAMTDLEGFAGPASFPAAAIGSLDFDGDRLAFATASCVYVARAAGLTVRAAPPAGPCARAWADLTAPRSAALSARNRTLRYAVACSMAPAGGCRGTLRLTFSRRGGGTATLLRARVAVPRGARETVAVRLGLQALEALRTRSGDRLEAHLQLEESRRTARAATRLTGPVRAPGQPPRPAPRPLPGGDDDEFDIG